MKLEDLVNFHDPEMNGSAPRLLLVEPDASQLQFLAHEFSIEGCLVDTALDATTAKHLLCSHPFDLVVVNDSVKGCTNDKALWQEILGGKTSDAALFITSDGPISPPCTKNYPGLRGLLSKPFIPSTVVATFKRLSKSTQGKPTGAAHALHTTCFAQGTLELGSKKIVPIVLFEASLEKAHVAVLNKADLPPCGSVSRMTLNIVGVPPLSVDILCNKHLEPEESNVPIGFLGEFRNPSGRFHETLYPLLNAYETGQTPPSLVMQTNLPRIVEELSAVTHAVCFPGLRIDSQVASTNTLIEHFSPIVFQYMARIIVQYVRIFCDDGACIGITALNKTTESEFLIIGSSWSHIGNSQDIPTHLNRLTASAGNSQVLDAMGLSIELDLSHGAAGLVITLKNSQRAT